VSVRQLVEDSAIAAAKSFSHPRVEARHVVFAICTLYPSPRLDPERAMKLLSPAGHAMTTEGFDAEAEKLLEKCATVPGAVMAAANWLRALDGADGGASTGGPSEASAGQRKQPDVKATELASETPAQVLAELDQLVGLAPVKKQVREVLAVVLANAERKRAGLPEVSSSLHLVFSGSPGTGKTTVARLVARLYAACGALKGAKFVEVHRGGLVGEYVGQTAPKTQAVLDAARPGVLFIDEAYSLVSESGNDYGREAVATLVKGMEDHRDSLAVIVAGYSEEMAEFIDMNPGLRSRFKTFIEFPDYAPEELAQIFRGFATEAQVQLAPGVVERASDLFRHAARLEDFGNARFARSLWERAFANMAVRAHSDGQIELHEVTQLLPADIPALPPPTSVEAEARIGFRGPGTPKA